MLLIMFHQIPVSSAFLMKDTHSKHTDSWWADCWTAAKRVKILELFIQITVKSSI